MGRITKRKLKQKAYLTELRKKVTRRKKQAPGTTSHASCHAPPQPTPSPPPPSPPLQEGFRVRYFYDVSTIPSTSSVDYPSSDQASTSTVSVPTTPSTSHERSADISSPPSLLRSQLFSNFIEETDKVCEEKLVVTPSQLNAMLAPFRCPVKMCRKAVKVNVTRDRFDTTIDVVCTGCGKTLCHAPPKTYSRGIDETKKNSVKQTYKKCITV